MMLRKQYNKVVYSCRLVRPSLSLQYHFGDNPLAIFLFFWSQLWM